MEAKTRTQQILIVMQILAWVAFVGYAIVAGAILVSYGVSLINPDAARNMYKGKDLYDLSQLNVWYYTGSVSFLVAIQALKSFVWLLVIKTLSELNLSNPFKTEVADLLERISYALLGVWVVGVIASAYSEWLLKHVGQQLGDHVSGEFIFMAGLVYIISKIFQRGIELQSENELTV